MSRKRSVKTLDRHGFTIVELMIATAVLSTILVLVTIIMISIGHLYYKGVSQARVQDDVRTIADELSQYLQLSNSTSIPVSQAGEQAYCIGSERFTYVLYKQIGTKPGQTPHVLWRDTDPSPGSCPTGGPLGSPTGLPNLSAATPSTGGVELIAPNSRLTDFTVTAISATLPSPYSISVAVAYGDDDLVCDSGYHAPNDCSQQGLTVHMTNIVNHITAPSGPIQCKGFTGDQFCATSSLTTTVAQRLTP